MKRLIASALLFCAVPLTAPAGCLVPKSALIGEFISCLVQKNAEALDEVQSELDTIDRNLYPTEEKLLKLEEVVTPASQWIEEHLREHRLPSNSATVKVQTTLVCHR